VLSSYSIETLVVLSVIAAVALLALAGLEALRSSMLQRLGARAAYRLGPHAFEIQLRGTPSSDAPALQPLRDVEAIRNLVGGPAAAAILDLPWSPIYFILLYVLHPVLFAVAVIACALIAGIAYLNDRANAAASAAAAKEQLRALQFAEVAARTGESVVAMGSTRAVSSHWLTAASGAMAHSLAATEREAGFHSFARFLRNALQLALLGVGAALTIAGELSGGGLIAGSILGARALQPIEAVVGAWRVVLSARQAWERLDEALAGAAKGGVEGMALPRPLGAISAENVTLVPPGAQRPILNRLAFELSPGEQLAIVGPSGSGKSTLVRAILGLAPCAIGNIRIDGSDVALWQKADLGQWIGYLPQVPLAMAGTVAQNIARFEDAPAEAVIAAAQAVNVHEMILSLPKGYDTDLGPGGVRLSGGQLQRIALAGALFGERPVVILDEPEAHLDAEGEASLRTALQNLRQRKATVIVVSHRPSAVTSTDKVLILRDGRGEFGPREEILGRIMRTAGPVATPRPRAAEGEREERSGP
jgi:PrtD family type I secretion system ABC transporter